MVNNNERKCVKKKFLRTALVMMSGLVVISGCARQSELRMQVGKEVEVPQKRVLVFFVDGMWADRVNEMICDGELPNMKKYLYDRGCCVEYAVSSIPSITYACIASATTGQFPGHHQIMSNTWFDRSFGKYQSYLFARSYQQVDHDLGRPTIYEVLRDKFTVTIQTANRRGATRPYDNWMSSGINWFFDRYPAIDGLVAQRFEEIALCSANTGHWPDYIFAYFPVVDHIGHEEGANSKKYHDAIINVDKHIGRICQGLETNGLLKDYYLILISDHGHVYAGKNDYWVPESFIRKELGLPVISNIFLEKGEPCSWHKYLKNYRVVVTDGGPRQAQIFLRCGKTWIGEPSYDQVCHFLRDFAPQTWEKMGRKDLIELLPEIPSVRVMTVKVDPNTVEVRSSQGRARIYRKIDPSGTKTYMYKPLENDPLGYLTSKSTAGMVNSGFYDSRTWLEASCQSEFPDFVPQIIEMCDSPRAGQIAIFARKGCDFSAKDLGGHGSVIHEDMNIPFILAGPDIPKGNIKTARLVDLFPTVLDMLGCSDRLKTIGPIDGESLLPTITQKCKK